MKRTRRSRASSLSRKSSISELYAEYSRRYDANEKLLQTKYNQTMAAKKLDRSSFEITFKAHAYPQDPRKTKPADKVTQGDIERYERWKPYKKYSAQRIIETMVAKESSNIAYKSAAILRKKIAEKFVEMDESGVPVDQIRIGEITEVPSISKIRFSKTFQVWDEAKKKYRNTNEFWEYVRNWYDSEGKELYQAERKKGKTGKEARQAIYDLFWYNGSPP